MQVKSAKNINQLLVDCWPTVYIPSGVEWFFAICDTYRHINEPPYLQQKIAGMVRVCSEWIRWRMGMEKMAQHLGGIKSQRAPKRRAINGRKNARNE